MDRFLSSPAALLVFLVSLFLASAQEQTAAMIPEQEATAELTGKVMGTITFRTFKNAPTHISGILCGLSPGLHGFHIHEKGDLSDGCKAAGGHYNPGGKTHGGPDSQDRHVGDLGNILANSSGCAHVDITDRLVSFKPPFSVLDRAVVVHEGKDDLGLGDNMESLTTGNAGGRAGCAVIKLTS